jgi:hypothetical protein
LSPLILSFILLILSPILIFVIQILTSRILMLLKVRVPLQGLTLFCVLIGNLPFIILFWIIVLQPLDNNTQIWGLVYCLFTYNALGHAYFHLVDLSITSIRVTLLQRISTQQITSINNIEMILGSSNSTKRLQRLQETGVIIRDRDRIFIKSRWLVYVGHICRSWGNLLGFGEEDNGYISRKKKVKYPNSLC